MWELLEFEHVKNTVDKKQVLKNYIYAACVSNHTIVISIYVISLYGWLGPSLHSPPLSMPLLARKHFHSTVKILSPQFW